MTMYKIFNPINSDFELFATKEEAESRLNVVKQEYIEQESYRFPVAKEIVEGNNTTWMAADLANDVEDYTYQVFNHNTGQHEAVSSLSQAKIRNQELKDAFLAEVFVEGVTEYVKPIPKQQISELPSTTIQ